MLVLIPADEDGQPMRPGEFLGLDTAPGHEIKAICAMYDTGRIESVPYGSVEMRSDDQQLRDLAKAHDWPSLGSFGAKMVEAVDAELKRRAKAGEDGA